MYKEITKKICINELGLNKAMADLVMSYNMDNSIEIKDDGIISIIEEYYGKTIKKVYKNTNEFFMNNFLRDFGIFSDLKNEEDKEIYKFFTSKYYTTEELKKSIFPNIEKSPAEIGYSNITINIILDLIFKYRGIDEIFFNDWKIIRDFETYHGAYVLVCTECSCEDPVLIEFSKRGSIDFIYKYSKLLNQVKKLEEKAEENNMNKLINVSEEVTVTSLDIAELTNTRHADVLRKAKKMMEDLGEKGERNFALTSYTDKSNRQSTMIEFSKRGSIMFMATYDVTVMDKLMNYIEELEDKIKKTAAVDAPDDVIMAKAIMISQNTIAKQEKMIKQQQEDIINKKNIIIEQKPKVDKYNDYLDSDGTTTTTALAKSLQMRSPQQLNKILIDNNIVYKSNHTMLKADYSTKGYNKKVAVQYKNKAGEMVFKDSFKWTAIGADFIIDLVKKIQKEELLKEEEAAKEKRTKAKIKEAKKKNNIKKEKVRKNKKK